MARELIRFDWAMKRLLRDKANFGVLEGFLSELLKFDLKIIQMGESEGNQQQEDDKFNRVDIIAHTSNEEIILIELQIDSELDYFHRMLYGVSKAVSEYIKKGDQYDKVRKLYSINIVYFHLGQGEDYVYHGKTEFRGLHKHDVLLLSPSQRQNYFIEDVHQIYPEYYILKVNDFNDIAKDGLDEWIYFLKNSEIKDSFKAKGLDKAKETLSLQNMSEEERRIYEKHWENKRYENSMMDGAKTEGRIEGREKRDIEIVLNALKMGMNLIEISDLTGLSEEIILQIITEAGKS